MHNATLVRLHEHETFFFTVEEKRNTIMKWKTAISTHKDGDLFIRGTSLLSLINERSFVEAIFLLLRGTLPTKKEERMLNILLSGMIEHGVQAPSAFVARSVVSTGNPFNAALAAGILAIGEYHGGAIEQCAKYLQSRETVDTLVDDVLKRGKRMPGFGHKQYKDKDPRTEVILHNAKRLGFFGTYASRALEIENRLEKKTGKKLPLNIDGAVAAIMLELGFDWRLGKAMFILGRLPGLIAHVHEEITREKPYRRLEDNEVEYDGPTLE